MNNRKRTWYPTKKAWARARVAVLDAEIAALRAEYYPSANWRAIRAKSAALDRMHQRRDVLMRIAGDVIIDERPTPF